MKKHAQLIALLVVTTAITCFCGYGCWRNNERSKIRGCNLTNLEMARLEVCFLEAELKCALSQTNTVSEDQQILTQKLTSAKINLEKWQKHVKKYGHLCGTGTDAKD